MDARSIVATISGEHPQVIAAVLSHLDASLAAEVLQLLPEEIQADMMYRVATLDSIQPDALRSEEHTSELQSLMRNSYAVFCLKKNKHDHTTQALRQCKQ